MMQAEIQTNDSKKLKISWNTLQFYQEKNAGKIKFSHYARIS